MPTEAFYKLPPDKKRVILDAAEQEFSAHSYDKVSVFNIARNAGMSRSGFYYYFSGKEDIYQLILFELRDELFGVIDRSGKQYDLFAFFEAAFSRIAAYKGTKREKLIGRIITNLRQGEPFILEADPPPCAPPALRSLSGLDELRCGSRGEYLALGYLLLCGITLVLPQYYSGVCTLEAAQTRLHYIFDLIKHGALKEGAHSELKGTVEKC